MYFARILFPLPVSVLGAVIVVRRSGTGQGEAKARRSWGRTGVDPPLLWVAVGMSQECLFWHVLVTCAMGIYDRWRPCCDHMLWTCSTSNRDHPKSLGSSDMLDKAVSSRIASRAVGQVSTNTKCGRLQLLPCSTAKRGDVTVAESIWQHDKGLDLMHC